MENVVSNDDSDRDNGDAVSKFEFSCESSIEQVQTIIDLNVQKQLSGGVL